MIGRGGLLGRSVENALRDDGAVWHPAHRFSWGDAERAQVELVAAARAFASAASGGPWQVAWCAGTGVVGSHLSVLDGELAVFSRFLTAMSDAFDGDLAGGAMFLPSSAGGVYAGVGAPPYTEASPVAPLSEYGWRKLKQEELAIKRCTAARLPLLIGRLSNLYGPSQDLAKNQGLITQVCLRAIARQPLHIYVPLDTIRDYLYADDAGRLVAAGLRRLRGASSGRETPPVVMKILASQQPVTIANVLAQFRWITKRPVSVVIGKSPKTRLQVSDLRMLSTVWPELDRRPLVSLSEGMRAVLTRILELAGSGRITGESVGGS